MIEQNEVNEQNGNQLIDKPSQDSEWALEMQETVLTLQEEIKSLKIKLAEEQIARRDQILMENLRVIREKKKHRNLWQQMFGTR
ncbi:hypothetical protein [Ammoniphilus resinae]|uniref:Uncharacterized protein n=1 Tax=Ammoniphilus resinae TaxID=861532 RepID=A0ABS4GRS5_9BACL|nr:hypothetical protein [Ammoniphilus resinae]MBP1932722.1 hypothetical protein [Ammoniphilus resinae]